MWNKLRNAIVRATLFKRAGKRSVNKITNIKIKNHDFKNVKKKTYIQARTYIQAKTNELIYLYFFL